jgi:acyl-CoA reductase-like NAD-dependent aldehyde dehydrogenase
MYPAAVAGDLTENDLLESLQEHFARNLIGGRWHFPAAPYEFEIRSPADSRVIAVVPLSSRFDVGAAVTAARLVLDGRWSDPDERVRCLEELLEHLERRQLPIATLQCAETGLGLVDSLRTVQVTIRQLRTQVAGPAVALQPGVSGHILSWGLPFVEALTSIWPALVAGNAVVVKPSLRAPLSAAYLGLLAEESGVPAGVINVVQGTGQDVGAELIRRQDLVGLYVRAGERTMAAAERARTGVPLHTVHAGGNVCVVGPAPGEVGWVADHVAGLVRMNSAGGVFGLPLLAVHPEVSESVLSAVGARLAVLTAAPLPSDSLRGRCLAGIAGLAGAGAWIRLGGAHVPDDVEHRMGWRVPPALIDLGRPGSAAANAHASQVPLGPVLGVLTVEHPSELGGALAPRRHADGIAWAWGHGMDVAADLPHACVVSDPVPADFADALILPPTWIGAGG